MRTGLQLALWLMPALAVVALVLGATSRLGLGVLAGLLVFSLVALLDLLRLRPLTLRLTALESAVRSTQPGAPGPSLKSGEHDELSAPVASAVV